MIHRSGRPVVAAVCSAETGPRYYCVPPLPPIDSSIPPPPSARAAPKMARQQPSRGAVSQRGGMRIAIPGAETFAGAKCFGALSATQEKWQLPVCHFSNTPTLAYSIIAAKHVWKWSSQTVGIRLRAEEGTPLSPGDSTFAQGGTPLSVEACLLRQMPSAWRFLRFFKK